MKVSSESDSQFQQLNPKLFEGKTINEECFPYSLSFMRMTWGFTQYCRSNMTQVANKTCYTNGTEQKFKDFASNYYIFGKTYKI